MLSESESEARPPESLEALSEPKIDPHGEPLSFASELSPDSAPDWEFSTGLSSPKSRSCRGDHYQCHEGGMRRPAANFHTHFEEIMAADVSLAIDCNLPEEGYKDG